MASSPPNPRLKRKRPKLPLPAGKSRSSDKPRAWPTWLARVWPRELSTMQIAMMISLAVHASLLVFRFVDPEGFKRTFSDTPLEVILVNARSDEPPTRAQAIAQVTLAGGGSALSGRATSPLPPSVTSARGESLDEARKRIERLQREQQKLLTSIRRELALLPPPDPRAEALGDPIERDNQERRRQLLRVLAEIERRINEENARPKKRYISPATREATYAIYYDALRRRIEDRGTRDFPEANGRKLYGELTMNITVGADGRLLESEVVRSSGNKMLDTRARAIVEASSPFGAFTEAMRRQADQIVVTSRFRFTRDDALSTTLTAN
jgi:periplasmic protein TonB